MSYSSAANANFGYFAIGGVILIAVVLFFMYGRKKRGFRRGVGGPNKFARLPEDDVDLEDQHVEDEPEEATVGAK
jgi:hypothetical protein